MPDAGGPVAADAYADEIDAVTRARIDAMLSTNVAQLQQRGLLVGRAPAITGLLWPLSTANAASDQWYLTANYVDLNTSFPNQLLDHACGSRTYDTATGYNHSGHDIGAWPFAWSLMDEGSFTIRAAASGIVIGKVDGNPDRSCSTAGGPTPNSVFVQHADGTVGQYYHLRNGTQTTKLVGQTVTAGEYLGQMGSSGQSSGPHLHFELRAPANGPVIEPSNGPCNAAPTAWASQRPYNDSRINRVGTHLVAPVLAQCPGTIDTPNLIRRAAPGALVSFAAYYRDQRHGQLATFRIRRPDQSVFQTWTFDSQAATGQVHLSAAYWIWNALIPSDGPQGIWAFESVFEGQTVTRTFEVFDGVANGFESPLL